MANDVERAATLSDDPTMTNTVKETQLDLDAVEVFAQQLVGTMVGATTTLMVALGHETGLFEAAAAGPGTSTGLAERAGLSERHVREWLGAMTTAGVFTYDPGTGEYTLPPEHAVLLTGDTAMNQAVMAPMILHLSEHVGAVAERFRSGGGISYDHYRPGFTDVMDLVGRRRYDAELVGTYLPLDPGLVEALEAGTSLADLGCGTGHCLNLMARTFPESSFVGYDLGVDAIERAQAEAEAWGLTNVRFEVRDVLTIDETFGALTAFDAIHDQVDPAGVLQAAHDALEPGGRFFMVDIKASSNVEDNVANPLAPMIYAISVLHCMEVSLAHDGAALGTAWGEQVACRMLGDAGFVDIAVHELEADPFNLVYTSRRPG